MRLLILVGLLAGCTEYGVSDYGNKPGALDSSGFTTDSDTGMGQDTIVDIDPDQCEDQNMPADDIAQTDECQIEGPTVGTFTPVVEWLKESFSVQPGSDQVMMAPMVGSLTDDDGDGDADADDIPDIVFVTYGTTQVIRVVSGDGGAELLNIVDSQLQMTGGIALGDIDGDGWQDIVAVTNNQVRAYNHRGNEMWTSASMTGAFYGTSDNPAISDMDHDGTPEIIVGKAILSNTGQRLTTGPAGMGATAANVGTTSFAVDLDGDGTEEVITGNSVFQKNGRVLWSNGQQDGYVAVGNFDGDAAGEVVVSGAAQVQLVDDNGAVLCTAPIPGAQNIAYYGGPATIADFNGDGDAEFALAAGSKYSVFNRNCNVIWQTNTQDASSGNTGSSVFDFEGDGIAEAVYADETRLWVFSGPDGAVKLESQDHTNNTWLEYPVIADVDGDGHAEVVVPNTAYGGAVPRQYSGITVIGDANNSWRSGRKIWNQHAYFITNINDDGSIPRNATQNWSTYNNFRSGDIGAGGVGYVAPDLIPEIQYVCADECDENRLYVWVSIGNRGYEDVTNDFTMELIGTRSNGNEVTLDSRTITDTVTAGRRLEAIEIVVENVPLGLTSIEVRLDTGNSADECVEDNNSDLWRDNLCPSP